VGVFTEVLTDMVSVFVDQFMDGGLKFGINPAIPHSRHLTLRTQLITLSFICLPPYCAFIVSDNPPLVLKCKEAVRLKMVNYVLDVDRFLGPKGAWLSEWLRRWSNKPDAVGLVPDTTEFFLISCDSNQVPKWFGTDYNLEVPL